MNNSQILNGVLARRTSTTGLGRSTSPDDDDRVSLIKRGIVDFVSAMRDNTRRIKAEAALRESQNRLSQARRR